MNVGIPDDGPRGLLPQTNSAVDGAFAPVQKSRAPRGILPEGVIGPETQQRLFLRHEKGSIFVIHCNISGRIHRLVC